MLKIVFFYNYFVSAVVQSHTMPFDQEAKAICDRVEKKIESLSRLGGSSKKDSQEVEKCAKEHVKKQSKIRRQVQK
jgi:hypothetical protein